MHPALLPSSAKSSSSAAAPAASLRRPDSDGERDPLHLAAGVVARHFAASGHRAACLLRVTGEGDRITRRSVRVAAMHYLRAPDETLAVYRRARLPVPISF